VKKGDLILILGLMLCLGWTGMASANEIQLDVREHTLSNGMTILVLENHAAPVFAGLIRFKTGSVDERPGITGISHYLEHMMFKGTKIFGTTNYEAEIPLMQQIDSLGELMLREQIKLQNVIDPPDSARYRELRQQIADVQAEQKQYTVKDELWSTYLQNGGTRLNAGTGNDATSYYVALPKNKLELWALLESDRLKNIIFREFYSERDVVMEERRLTLENEPRGRLDEAFGAAMFWATPYSWPVVGWMSDLQRISHDDLKEYFKTHYAPGNAVAAIVGDIDTEEVIAMCEKYFGAIPAQPVPPPVMTIDDKQMGERRVEVIMDASPRAFVGWHIPRVGHPDIAALDVAANILSSGRTSRFHKNIKETRLGAVRASAWEGRIPAAFYCTMTPMGDHTTEELEKAVYAEIDKLKTEPVTEWELQKVRNKMQASLLRGMNSNLGIARRITSSKTNTGDWRHFLKAYDDIKKVTADDVMRVVNKYLTRDNRTIAYIVKAESEDETAIGDTGY